MESSNDALIDFERLREVADDDADMMNMLVEMYLDQMREILTVLKTAVAEKDFETIRQSAHKAVGSSATCGMNAVVAPLKELEQLGASKNPQNAEAVLVRIETAHEQISAALEASKANNFQ